MPGKPARAGTGFTTANPTALFSDAARWRGSRWHHRRTNRRWISAANGPCPATAASARPSSTATTRSGARPSTAVRGAPSPRRGVASAFAGACVRPTPRAGQAMVVAIVVALMGETLVPWATRQLASRNPKRTHHARDRHGSSSPSPRAAQFAAGGWARHAVDDRAWPSWCVAAACPGRPFPVPGRRRQLAPGFRDGQRLLAGDGADFTPRIPDLCGTAAFRCSRHPLPEPGDGVPSERRSPDQTMVKGGLASGKTVSVSRKAYIDRRCAAWREGRLARARRPRGKRQWEHAYLRVLSTWRPPAKRGRAQAGARKAGTRPAAHAEAGKKSRPCAQ